MFNNLITSDWLYHPTSSRWSPVNHRFLNRLKAAPRPPRFVTPTKGPVESSFRRVNPERWECHSLTDEMYGLSMINILMLCVHMHFTPFVLFLPICFQCLIIIRQRVIHLINVCVVWFWLTGLIYIIWCYILLSTARSFYFGSSYKKSYGSPHKTAGSRSTKLFFEIARDHQDFPCIMDSSRFCVAKSAWFWGMVWPVLEAQNFCLRDGCLFCFFRFVLCLMPLFHTFLWNSENVSNR